MIQQTFPMKKIFGLIIFALILMFFILTHFIERPISRQEYTLTIISNPGDRIDLYKYVDYPLSHQGEEIFYLKQVNEEGKLSVKLPPGKYTIFARCMELGCQRSFDGPKVINLDKDMTITLKWKHEY